MSAKLTFAVNDLPGGVVKRLAEAILYVCAFCESDDAFGMTRLNKILFEADFLSFLTRDQPVTGAAYQRLQHGPAPKAMPHRLRELQQEGALHVRETDYLGKIQKKPIALRKPDLSVFNGEDLAVLHKIIQDSWGKSAGEVSDASHRIEWKTRQNGDPIPYEAAWLSNELPTDVEVVRTRQLAAEHGW
jgi:hypothetical protein